MCHSCYSRLCSSLLMFNKDKNYKIWSLSTKLNIVILVKNACKLPCFLTSLRSQQKESSSVEYLPIFL